MARRRKKSRSKGKKKLPILPMLPAVVPAVMAYKAVGISSEFPNYFVWQLTGYSPSDDAWNKTVMKRQIGLVAVGAVGHMIANKYINKKLPKWIPISL